jgi:hypothetical protein
VEGQQLLAIFEGVEMKVTEKINRIIASLIIVGGGTIVCLIIAATVRFAISFEFTVVSLADWFSVAVLLGIVIVATGYLVGQIWIVKK